MEWTELNIYTTTEGIDLICSRLMDIGVKGFAIKDAEDFNEFLENKNGKWDYIDEDLLGLSDCETCITIYLPNNNQGAEMLISVNAMLKEMKAADTENVFGRLETDFSSIREEDWANNWKQYFKPLTVGEKILILPEWETLEKETDRTVFVINPGMSFGTGSHHTTRLCLERLEKYIKPGMNVLDLGCGSGILSQVALLLGATSATAVDIDPNAAKIARENAERNGISEDRYRIFAGNVLEDEELVKQLADRKYDLVLANIVADVIIALAPQIPVYLKEKGVYITSGIITDRGDEVMETYKKLGMTLENKSQSGDWLALDYKI